MEEHALSNLGNIFRAVADPNRYRIMLLLRHHGEMNVSSITHAVGMSQPAVSQHLRILKDMGALRSRKEGQQVYYCVPSEAVCDALEAFIKVYQKEIISNDR